MYHQLISLSHNSHCIDKFLSNIDHLNIGNINNEQNQINFNKKDIRKLQKEINTFKIEKINLNNFNL